jgi:YggT family protein
MGTFIYVVITTLLTLVIWAIVINAVMSWLVAFNVINLRNPFVHNVARFLDAVTRPVLAPFQRFIPTLAGIDISPIIAIVILQAANRYLLPWIFAPIIAAIG